MGDRNSSLFNKNAKKQKALQAELRGDVICTSRNQGSALAAIVRPFLALFKNFALLGCFYRQKHPKYTQLEIDITADLLGNSPRSPFRVF